jgi:hypothetical protein
MTPQEVDGVLVEWGERLFFGQRNFTRPPRGADPLKAAHAAGLARQAARIRQRVGQLTSPRAHQVMVKVTGGGRGMKAIRAHLTYISKHGKLEMQTDRGEVVQGKDALRDVVADWRIGGHSVLPEQSSRREAFHIIFSMPDGTPPQAIKAAAAAVARAEFAGHVYAIVLHEHQAHPHVHLAVRAQGFSGKRLNPRKADLARWREGFARELRDRGIEAIATRQPVHGASRNHPPRWRLGSDGEGRTRLHRPAERMTRSAMRSRLEAFNAWGHIHSALAASALPQDRELAHRVSTWLSTDPEVKRTRLRLSELGSRSVEAPQRSAGEDANLSR